MKTFLKGKEALKKVNFKVLSRFLSYTRILLELGMGANQGKTPPNLNSRVFDSIAIKQGKTICKEIVAWNSYLKN
jgi:hypothetical protein